MGVKGSRNKGLLWNGQLKNDTQLTCADCDRAVKISYSAEPIRAKGKIANDRYEQWWWICEQCAVERGWIW